ncbi:baseplate J/gp47 family protein [Sporolactobacillus shoreicorticis]|uniref:Baseplate J/gp47 family protein n=1 Tax=Sporolactobacillus shoreicorticis TaxID=1923877 RepID=A0ABW5S795_9BACL|nr:baseplate J/gp47 family protein [Sporolactobacillus shoreicorticis]MCO7127825.1 baseplate J/gp47 family protein [Sporolactobacillus shoreicorticis]
MLDENGFQKKSYADLVSDMQDKAKQLWGEDVNVSEKSFLGILIILFAWFLSIAWELAESVYNAGFVTKSEGVQLDRLSTLMGTSRIPAASSYATLSINGQPNYVVEEGTVFATESGIQFETIAELTLDAEGKGTVDAVSVDTGVDTNVAAGSITVQANPDSNITSVTNPEAATGGRDQETDVEFRQRLVAGSSSTGNATFPSIVAKLLETSGVRSANVITNSTMETDSAGNPPKSVHAYVLGGTAADVADTLLNSVAAGIETVGSQSVDVTDDSGTVHTIKFDFASEVDIAVQVSVSTNPTYEIDGDDQIKQNIVDYTSGLKMGEDVIYSRLFSCAYAVVGIDDVTITVGRSNDEELGTTNVVIGPNEVAQIKSSDIEVIHA